MPYRLVPKSALRRFGRRDLSLLIFGIVWMLQGLYLITDRSPVHGPENQVPHMEIPWPWLGLLWMAFGAVGAATAFMHREKDHFGFLAVSVMPLVYAASYFVSFGTWLVTFSEKGWEYGIIGGFIWGCVSVLIGVISAWPEAPEGGVVSPPVLGGRR